MNKPSASGWTKKEMEEAMEFAKKTETLNLKAIAKKEKIFLLLEMKDELEESELVRQMKELYEEAKAIRQEIKDLHTDEKERKGF
jgi:hypothetical protein